MPFSEKEMREDLRQVRIREYMYLGGGIGIMGLAVALIVVYLTKSDWPALVLAAVGFFWSAMLLYHGVRTRRLEVSIRGRIDGGAPGEP
jgi:hypothetical protein